jgi:DNA-binding beta-propeller fold protein YncE
MSMSKRNLYIGAIFVALIATLAIGSAVLGKKAVVQAAGIQAPKFEVDPLWPKPLPNHWLLGNTIGVSVDSNDHIWIIHRGATLERLETLAQQNPPEADCCASAPPVLEFDEAGNLLRHWGGPGQGYEWPTSNHGITVDFKGNVWIAGNGGTDGQVLKFTQDGKFLMQIGHQGQPKANSNDKENLFKPAETMVDPKTNELYVADGYGNHRVVVFDADTGKYKRHWGAYGHVPDDTNLGRYNPDDPPAQQFRNPVHCAQLSNDGFLYVCDRVNDRIQVFKPDGTFVKEAFIEKKTLGDGAAWDIAFSKDPQQRYLFLADGTNEKIHVLQRNTLEILTNFGDGGRQPGAFYAVHSIAADSKGNLFTTETYRGQRVQKFVFKGIGTVSADQGVVWPKKP